MSDLRSGLERLGDRVRVAPDAFERLERARRRRERNRRIMAGAVALLVAIAGSVAAFTAFRTNDGGQPIAGADQNGFFALWPEQTAEGLAAAQAAVDAGDPDFAWRSDPSEVARRFALDELLWPAVTVSATPDSDPTADGELFLDVAVPPGLVCDQIVADATCPTTSVTLKMVRLGSANGLWSVVRVNSPDLVLPFRAGEEVASGTTVTMPTFLPEGTKVSMGVSFLTACGGAGTDENVEVSQGLLRFTVPGVPDRCVGYVYAMTPRTGVGAVSIGSFLFSDAPAVPSIGYLVDEIAAVPVLFTNTPAEPSNVAEFTCDATGTIFPSSLSVDAQPDGVHVAVTNAADEHISFTVGGHESTMYVVGDGGADPGERKEIVLGLPPGDADVSCVLGSKGGIDTSPIADLRVEDPTGSFTPIGMECPMSSQHVDDATGFQGDPIEVARQHLSGLEYDDAVERVGYPNSRQPVVRVVRNGDVVAMATFKNDEQGGWLVDTVVTCVNVLIRWSDEVTGVTSPMGSPSPLTAWDALCAAAREGGVHNGKELHITGQDISFDTRCLIAPAGEPLTILFRNLDAGVQRSLSIYELTPFLRECIVTGTSPLQDVDHALFRGELVEGVDEIAYDVGPLEPGEYYFQDDVHPNSNGVLVVE
jgi:hypothetical protein